MGKLDHVKRSLMRVEAQRWPSLCVAESKLCSGSVVWACQESPSLGDTCTDRAEFIGITVLAA